MIGEILKFSIQHRWIMLALTLIINLGANLAGKRLRRN